MIGNVVFKNASLFLVISGSIVFFMTYEMFSNTSFDIASRHMSSVHNYACNVKRTDKVYVVVRDSASIVNRTDVADVVAGIVEEYSAVTSTSYTIYNSTRGYLDGH